MYIRHRTLTLCSLRSLSGSKQTTQQFGNITADIVVGTVHCSETQRREIVELRCVQERRFIHQLTQALQQRSHINTFITFVCHK